ncbi:MAG: fatty acid desaturase [Acidobacteriota bacterium]|nr:fatty acid desaturase [Acidobacteriota bacterium]
MKSFLMAFLVSVAVTQMAVFATTIYLHRAATHRSLVLHPAIAWFFRLAIWISTGIVPREWVAVHRKHHKYTDKEGDPHSPLIHGFWKVQLGNVYYYVRETKDVTLIPTYARDLMRADWWDKLLFNHGSLGLAVGISILCASLGLWWGLLTAVLHAVMYVFVLSSSVNGLCHTVGYKNFANTATNLKVVAWIAAGEGLHNNHHGFPRSPKFSFNKGEFDPAWPIIRAMIALGLARPYKTIDESV